MLTEEDVLSGRDFPDEIARCCWGIDVHNPTGTHTGIERPIRRTYGIPYRCITPRGISNLYIAGRPISATHRAFSSSRINSTCIMIGEAVGWPRVALRQRDTRKADVAAVPGKAGTGGNFGSPLRTLMALAVLLRRHAGLAPEEPVEVFDAPKPARWAAMRAETSARAGC